MGGNDKFYVRGTLPRGKITIDGGLGNDLIDTEGAHVDGQFFLTSGGPERDRIKGGESSDFIVVENDEVSDQGGKNSFVVKGNGHDIVVTGLEAGLIVVKKTSDATQINPYSWPREDDQKPKRIVYESGSLTNYRTTYAGPPELEHKPFLIRGSTTPHDVISMKNFKPAQSSSSMSSDPMVVLVPDLLINPVSQNLTQMSV